MTAPSSAQAGDALRWQRIRTIENPWVRQGLAALAVVYLLWSLTTLEINWTRVAQGLPRAVNLVLRMFPPDFSQPIYVNLPTNKGKDRRYVKYGQFKFKWEGKDYALQIYRPLGGGELFLPFKDKTSGMETNSEGRYLYVEPMTGGNVLIDFNRAHNPFCQYNDKYTCPFALPENGLPIPILAGEKRFR